MRKYLKATGDTNNNISSWKYKALSAENIMFPSKPKNILAPLISYVDFTITRKKIKFN